MGCIRNDLVIDSDGWCVLMGIWVAKCQSQGSSVPSTSVVRFREKIRGRLVKNKSQGNDGYK